MLFNKYILGIVIAALLGWVAFAVVVFRLNPYSSSQIALPFFFLSLFIALSATLSLAGFYIRVIFYKHEIFYNHINVSLRQGLLLALGICGLVTLQMLRTLTWWDGLLLLLIIFLIEFYFMTREEIA